MYVASSDEQARTECRRPPSRSWFHNINFLWEKAGYDFLNFIRDFDDLEAREIVIVPALRPRCREKVQRAVDETGVNYFCPILAWGRPHPGTG